MWILFLLAFLILVFWRYWYLIMQEELIGMPYNTPGHSFYWAVSRYRLFAPPENYIGIDAALGTKFHFYRERYWHRIAKWFGICHEFQTSDPDFDTKVFIGTKNCFMGKALKDSPTARAAVLEIFKGNVLYIHCDGRRLWARLRKTGYEPPGEKELCQLMPHMHILAETLTGLNVSWLAGRNPA